MIDYLEQDVCERCEMVFVVDNGHRCSLRRALRALRARRASGKVSVHLGPMIVRPVPGPGVI